MDTVTGLLLMSAAMGVYQGFNPTMGWLHATARGLERRSTQSLLLSGTRFAWGHYLGMNVVLVPMAFLLALTKVHPTLLMPWMGTTFIVYGLFKLIRPSHPRLLARIPPTHTVRWSFTMALVHCGSPLMMLSPLFAMVMIGHGTHEPYLAITNAIPLSYIVLALEVSAAMALPQLLVSLIIALVVYSRLGLRALTRYWINFDLGWAFLFIVMGTMALRM